MLRAMILVVEILIEIKIDFDYYKRFRDELNGIYSEIYKFCCDLFICAW